MRRSASLMIPLTLIVSYYAFWLVATVLSGAVFQFYGLEACLWASAALVAVAAWCSRLLPPVVAVRG